MTLHARLGASKADRWMNCVGSIRMTADIEETSSKYADEGTAAHALAAQLLLGETKPFDRVVCDNSTVEVTQEMLDAVQVYVDYVNSRRPALIFIEQQFDLAALKPPEPMFGTADCVLWWEEDRVLEVIDYKHGQGVYVEVQDNPQFLMYALGAIVAIGKRPLKVITTVVQPRHSAEPKVRSAEYTMDEIVAFKKELFAKAVETQAEDAPLCVGSWCRFCPALARCPAQHANAIELAQCEFEVMALDGNDSALPYVDKMSDEQLKFVLGNMDLVRSWFNAVEQHATNKLLQGEEFPGYKLVAGTKHRRWVDEAHAAQYLTRKGLKKSERTTSKLISPAQAEKLFKAKDLGVIPERFVEKPVGAPTLAPLSDKRPAITDGAQSEFEVLPPHSEE